MAQNALRSESVLRPVVFRTDCKKGLTHANISFAVAASVACLWDSATAWRSESSSKSWTLGIFNSDRNVSFAMWKPPTEKSWS
eukprot:3992269-Prymnesium_polylepis.1